MSLHSFLGYAVLYALRFNLSVAIVDMVEVNTDVVRNQGRFSSKLNTDFNFKLAYSKTYIAAELKKNAYRHKIIRLPI